MAFQLTKKQSRAWHTILENPLKRRVFFDGGVRSTKTFLICTWLANQASIYPGAPILIARKYREHARDSLYTDTLKKILGGRPEWEFRDSLLEIHHRNGSFLRIGGLDDKDRVDKVLGTEYAHTFFNECTQLSWETITTVLSRLSSNTVPVRKGIFDCNPKSMRHDMYRVGVMNVDPATGLLLPDAETWARMHWTPYDNPHLPPDAIATLEAFTGVKRRRLLNGEWCSNDGAVYDEFDEDVHVIDEMPRGWHAWQFVRGIDFGYTNPFVRLCGAVDPDGRLYIFREHYKSKMIVRDHAAVIKAEDAESYDFTVADHDAEDRATLHDAEIYTTAAEKSILPGINAVKERLKVAADGRPRLLFLRPCVNSISEMIGYSWPASMEGRNEKEAPLKENDHCPDVVRYIVARLDGLSGGWGPSGTA